jgi:hypothetical protein
MDIHSPWPIPQSHPQPRLLQSSVLKVQIGDQNFIDSYITYKTEKGGRVEIVE